MQTQTDIHFEFDVAVSPETAYAAIVRPKDWWMRDTEGNTTALGDTFTVFFNRQQDLVRFSVMEAVPGRRSVWRVDDCYLQWFEDKHEWTGTEVIFEIVPTAAGCTVSFVHRGVTPDSECYAMCNPGWEGYVTKSLYQLITTGCGMPK